ncbi:MAG: Rrf2 family transcriptional regulator, partial [Candidatus Omnitrophota bacterium]
QSIPMRYLVQILLQLKRLGLVKSVRGKGGGYNIAKPLSEITLGTVVRSMSGELLSMAESAAEEGSLFKPIWQEVDAVMSEVLDRITFEDILTRAEGADKVINFQI